MQLSIIIVHYKTPELLLNCLQSIAETCSDLVYETIVVDNNSEDQTSTLISSKFAAVKWIQLHSNDGFGRANNAGLKEAIGQYVLLLNSDTIVKKDSIQNSLNYLQQFPDIGVLGCRLMNSDGSFQNSTYPYIADYYELWRENIVINSLFSIKPQRIKAVMGAFMLIPRKVMLDVHGFDTDFFMYFEELEMCNRISKSGFRIAYYPAAEIIHIQGGSSGNGHWSCAQAYLSQALLYYKIRGIAGYFIFHFINCINILMNSLVLWKIKSKYRGHYKIHRLAYLSNFKDYFKIPFLFSRKSSSSVLPLIKTR